MTIDNSLKFGEQTTTVLPKTLCRILCPFSL